MYGLQFDLIISNRLVMNGNNGSSRLEITRNGFTSAASKTSSIGKNCQSRSRVLDQSLANWARTQFSNWECRENRDHLMLSRGFGQDVNVTTNYITIIVGVLVWQPLWLFFTAMLWVLWPETKARHSYSNVCCVVVPVLLSDEFTRLPWISGVV